MGGAQIPKHVGAWLEAMEREKKVAKALASCGSLALFVLGIGACVAAAAAYSRQPLAAAAKLGHDGL